MPTDGPICSLGSTSPSTTKTRKTIKARATTARNLGLRWVDEDRYEILARLLDLNRVRAEEEAQSTPATPAAKTGGKRKRKSIRSAPVRPANLFEVDRKSVV